MKKIALLLPLLLLASCGGSEKIEISGYGYSEDKAFNLSQAKAAYDYPGFEKTYGELKGVYVKGIVTKSFLNDPSGDGAWAGQVVIKEEGKSTDNTLDITFFGIDEVAKSNYEKNASRLFDFSPCSLAGYEVIFKGDINGNNMSKKLHMESAELISFSRGVVERVDKPNLVSSTYNFQYVPAYYKPDAKTNEKVNEMRNIGASLSINADRDGIIHLSVSQYLESQNYFSKVVVTMNTPSKIDISYSYREGMTDYEDHPYVTVPYKDYQSVVEFKGGVSEVYLKVLYGEEPQMAWKVGFELIEKN